MNDSITGYPAAEAPPLNPKGYGGAADQQPPRGTACQCAAPPPAYNKPNPYNTKHKTSILRVIGMTIACLSISSATFFFLCLILHYQNPEFIVDSLLVSNLNLTNSLISSKWDLHFNVTNPSEMIFYYNDITTTVLYDDVSLFFQEKRTELARQAIFAIAGAYMGDRAFVEMNKERSQKGVIGFSMRVVDGVRFRDGSWSPTRIFVMVYCKDMSVGVGSTNSSGTLLGGVQQCKVDL